MMIDAVIPFHQKDREVFGWCVRGIREHLDVARILVVGNRELRWEIERAGVIFVDEDSVVEGLTVSSFSGWRWGWYFQQILKLGMADKVATDYYLVVDADTVFIRNVELFNGKGKPLYAIGTEYHKPYFDVFEQLLGFKAQREYSFTVHHMIYSRHIVKEMRSRFKDLPPWWMNIVKYVEPQAPWFSKSQFNEQETYGHYIKALYPDEVNLRFLRWANLNVSPTGGLLRRLAKEFDFCTFHAQLRNHGPFRRIWLRLKLEMQLMGISIGSNSMHPSPKVLEELFESVRQKGQP